MITAIVLDNGREIILPPQPAYQSNDDFYVEPPNPPGRVEIIVGPQPSGRGLSQGDEPITKYRAINDLALANYSKWVPALFGRKAVKRDKGYRVTSKSLGRDLQEDLSFHPDGIKDFGLADMSGETRDGNRSPLDVVIEYDQLGPIDLDGAFRWLSEKLCDKTVEAGNEELASEQPEPKPTVPAILRWIDMARWDREPAPPREWAIRDRAPRRQAGLFSGEGGTGKSIIEMMKNVCHVTGQEWLGAMPTRGATFYIGCEDEPDEFHRRFEAIAAHYGTTFRELIDGGLMALCKLGEDATLCALSGKSGKVETTEFYRHLYEAAGDIKPINISIDTLSRTFAGNEIDRVQVYAFAMHMQALAVVANGSVTVLSHPSLAGIASGSGISGSTAWHGAFRFRQYLKSARVTEDQPDSDLRELEFKKNQYGPTGESIALRWSRGLFLPVSISSLGQAVADAEVDALFLDLLDKFTAQGRNVSHLKQAHSCAPALFAKAAPGTRKTAFEGAMERLFLAGRIKVETYGKPSRQYTRLVRA